MDNRSSGTKPPQFDLSGTTQIQRWQETTGYELESHDLGIVARATTICLRSLGFIAQHALSSMCSKSQQRLLRRRYKMLKLWANGYGALDSRLDATLDRSDDLRQTIMSVLSPMCEVLLKCLTSLPVPQADLPKFNDLCANAKEVSSQMKLLVADADGRASSDESDSDRGCDTDQSTAPSIEFKEKVKEITIYVQCLIDLGTALQCPAVADEHDDHATFRLLEERTANDYHAGLISIKYPRADTLLVEQLGQISWARFLRMQHEREKITTERDQLQERLIADATKSLVSISEFQDSGLGTSLPTTTSSYAESTVSFMTSISGGERVRIPPLPAEGKTGAPFDCTACGRSVRATNNLEWRKHLYTDLQPYTCFYTGCPFNKTPFASRQLWSDHLELGHKLGSAWEAVKCPLCLHYTGNGRSTVLTHFARHMEDIALIALPLTIDSDADSDCSIESEFRAPTFPEKGTEFDCEPPQTSPSVASAFPSCRVRLFELEKGEWLYRGTGQFEGEGYLLVVKEDNFEVRYPTKGDSFLKQKDTLIIWKSADRIDMAISFQEPDNCTKIWNFLVETTMASKVDDITASKPNDNEDANVTSSQEQNISPEKHRARFRDPNIQVIGLVLASGKFKCSAPSCSKLRFGRHFDFQRHHNHVHVAEGSKFHLSMTKDEPSAATFATSGRVYDSGNDSDSEGRITGCILASGKFKCSEKTCSDLFFGRQADWKRHHITVHASKAKEYFCSHLGCGRSKKPSDKSKGRSFGSRKDKMEEHMQVVHMNRSSRIESSIGVRAQGPMSDSDDCSIYEITRIRSTSPPQRSYQDYDESVSVQVVSKTPYVHPQHPKIMCQLCNERPDGYRGTHELDRHIARAHAETRKGYICIAPAFQKSFLNNCEHCRNKKVYGAYYNAAAHLLRTHFHPRKRGRKGKNDEKRGGIGGGDHPAMDWLKQHWIQEIEVPNFHTSTSPESEHDDASGAESAHRKLDVETTYAASANEGQLTPTKTDHRLGSGSNSNLYDISPVAYQAISNVQPVAHGSNS
ncbi:uncharacterized protein EKO05_0006691 [Ascochyta rabiei]|uniref:uncharacterized protein n=1 Tax=Didymella rabiei TaxID=5454 RepID=UPI0019013CA1|nr:uncharacterized protein EKO05_0006691 [Ascochyta rabiei]UPX16282.1 hypothetical protein EKO05_0006691 [Ascochyta rabiei]